MTLLLDTHVVIWWLTADANLAESVRQRIAETPAVHLSAASVWEIAIKQQAGRLKAPADLADRATGAGFVQLPMTAAHAIVAARLPAIHNDPFDRMLIAQAQHEGLTLVTHDGTIPRYDVDVLAI